MNHTTWSLGTVVWLPICVLSVAGLIVLSRWLFGLNERVDSYDRGVPKAGAIASIVVVVLLVLGTAFGMYPYSAQYHQWRPVEGKVQTIDNRLIGTGDGMATKFVVRFVGSDQQYGCDDTRCASVRAGDFLSLSCKRTWQFTGTDGYDCRFYSTEAAR